MNKGGILKYIWRIAKYIVIPVAFMLLLSVIYEWADKAAMGEFADWVDNKMMVEYNTTDSNGNEMVVRKLDWSAFKYYVMQAMLIIVAATCIIFLIGMDMKKRKTKREDAYKISNYIDRFIIKEEPLPADIPAEYGEVFTKLSEVRYKEQKREQELINETTRKDDLVTYLAHDLKTPLTSVIGYLTLLKDEPGLSEEMRTRYTDVAVSKSERLEELINELFEITRYNINKVELTKGNVNLSVMVEQILFEFTPLLSEKHLNFVTDIKPNVEVYVDVDKMERVIDNLIRNAVHYSYPDTDIKVELSLQEGNNIIFIIENRGKNIPNEKIERLFEQFYRLDSSRSSLTGGSGLGLAIAKQLVEAHGGTITAESKNERIRFIVRLLNTVSNS